jgi:hypothetical protein
LFPQKAFKARFPHAGVSVIEDESRRRLIGQEVADLRGANLGTLAEGKGQEHHIGAFLQAQRQEIGALRQGQKQEKTALHKRHDESVARFAQARSEDAIQRRLQKLRRFRKQEPCTLSTEAFLV